MKESRLFKIVYHLLDKGQATASELAEKLEVSIRTIYRDIDSLSAAGIPIYTETGRTGGIRLMSDFVLDKTVLSQAEKQEILASLQSVNAIQNIDFSETMSKLSAVFDIGSDQWLEVDFSRWGCQESDNIKFQLLKTAVIHHQAVRIIYASSYELTDERCIYPLRLVYQSKAWYLKAYCTKKHAYRMFKLNRIIRCEMLEEHFDSYTYPKETEESKQEFSAVMLRFSKHMAYRVFDEFDISQVEIQANGDFLVSAQMSEDAWLIGYLLSFGNQVEVIAPLHLKEILAEQAKLIYDKNKP